MNFIKKKKSLFTLHVWTVEAEECCSVSECHLVSNTHHLCLLCFCVSLCVRVYRPAVCVRFGHSSKFRGHYILQSVVNICRFSSRQE